MRGAHRDQFNRASRTNCQQDSQPSPKPAGCPENELSLRSKYRAPSAGIECSDGICESTTRNMHQGARPRRHACPYCSAEKAKTYSTFLDWRNHLSDTHEHCMEDDDPLQREEYAAGFKLNRWGRFHELEGNENDRAYQRVATLRKDYGWYQGPGEGEPPGLPSTIRLPHTKGTMPDSDTTLAGSEHGESGQEEGEVTQAEGDEPGSFTQMKSRDTDSGSEDTSPGRDSWRSARGRETVMLTTPWTRGRSKRRVERGRGTTKRLRMESSSSERRDESEESMSGGTRDQPGRGGRRAARTMTPLHGTCPSLRKPTGGRPTLDRSVEMSTGGGRTGHHGALRTTDSRARAGGPGQGNLLRPS